MSETARIPEIESGEAPPAAADEAATSPRLASIVESVLFAAGAPLSVKRLVEILAGPRGSGPRAKEVQQVLQWLQSDYAAGKRGIQLVEVAGGYQLRTARENAQWVRAVFRDKPARLGRAALETLAIVAYKQPATRADIEAVRGVDAEAALTTLLERRLVKIVGRKEAVGRPLLYATTPEFLEAFGLKGLEDLPSLKELGPVPDEQQEERPPADPAGAPEDGPPARTLTAEAAEALEPGGNQLAPQGRRADPGRPGEGERPGDQEARDEGRSSPGPHHG